MLVRVGFSEGSNRETGQVIFPSPSRLEVRE